MTQTVTVTTNGIKVRPSVNREQVKEIAKKCFGLEIDESKEIKEAVSYDDRNFLFKGKLNCRGSGTDKMYQSFEEYVLKIYNASETSVVSWYKHINNMVAATYEKCQSNFKIPFPIADVKTNENCVLYDIPLEKNVEASEELLHELCLNNQFVSKENSSYYVKHVVRLTVFIPGQTVDVKNLDDDLAFKFGSCVAQLATILKDFPKPEEDLRQDFVWNTLYTYKTLQDPYILSMKDETKKTIAIGILQKFEKNVLPKLENLSKQWIHGDLNELNLLTCIDNNGKSRITGIVDFDDMCYSYSVIDVGTALMYITYSSPRERCFDIIKKFIRGYTSVLLLGDTEKHVLFTIMLTRYIQSCIVGEYQYYYVDPTNEYLLLTPSRAWETLKFLMNEGEDKFLEVIS
ncbi:hydroxylysine kinase-like [Hydractinia symbiolongicarpus]|uniref:hydroxylysine kinase-like n=1 Tax=Hydractinia symbiolongicarpus TaxID=13093 RepID=UPI0025507FE7|nr:hydroxylysine kinase-like [Hydractinia symbiolongicarpus]